MAVFPFLYFLMRKSSQSRSARACRPERTVVIEKPE